MQHTMTVSEKYKLRKRRRLSRVMNASTSLFGARLSYCMMFITTVLFAAFYLHTFFYLILALLLALPVFSYSLTKYAFSSITASVSFDRSSCEKGEECMLEIIISNSSPLPVSSFELTVDVRSMFYGSSGPKIHSLQLKPGDNLLSFPVQPDKYGVYIASISSPVIFDYLHLFSVKRELDMECALTVMPDVGPREERHEAIYEEGFDEFTDNQRRGNASSNVTDIREYQPGDRLSRIHWKLTEKLDTLIVKENEATSSNDFTVLLELYQPSREECDKDPSLCNVLNNAIEEAMAVSGELIRAGEPFIFMFYNEKASDFVQIRINSEDDLNEAMTQAFYAGCYDKKDLALSVYQRSGQDKGTLIHVN